jgi:hypothetical protein
MARDAGILTTRFDEPGVDYFSLPITHGSIVFPDALCMGGIAIKLLVVGERYLSHTRYLKRLAWIAYLLATRLKDRRPWTWDS